MKKTAFALAVAVTAAACAGCGGTDGRAARHGRVRYPGAGPYRRSQQQ